MAVSLVLLYPGVYGMFGISNVDLHIAAWDSVYSARCFGVPLLVLCGIQVFLKKIQSSLIKLWILSIISLKSYLCFLNKWLKRQKLYSFFIKKKNVYSPNSWLIYVGIECSIWWSGNCWLVTAFPWKLSIYFCSYICNSQVSLESKFLILPWRLKFLKHLKLCHPPLNNLAYCFCKLQEINN